jgi:RNA polymerase sigma factor (sigma-70 family)
VPAKFQHHSATLACEAAAGDRAAWEALVERFTPSLRSVIRGFRLAPVAADDVLQETWLAAYMHISKLRKPEAIGSWLTVTARREALRSLQRSVHEVLSDDPQPSEVASDDAHEAALAGEQLQALRTALTKLPERQRKLIEALFSPEEPSYAELSARLGIPIGAIGPTRARALARLRRDLDLKADRIASEI